MEKQVRPLGPLEALAMECLWRHEDALTVRDVRHELSISRPVAYTTVMTVLDHLYRKGHARRKMDGRVWRYTPARSRAEHTALLMREALKDAGAQAAALTAFVAALDDQTRHHLRAALRTPRESGSPC